MPAGWDQVLVSVLNNAFWPSVLPLNATKMPSGLNVAGPTSAEAPRSLVSARLTIVESRVPQVFVDGL